jgi:hypothetical protein
MCFEIIIYSVEVIIKKIGDPIFLAGDQLPPLTIHHMTSMHETREEQRCRSLALERSIQSIKTG